MAEILDDSDDSVCDLTEPEVIDLSADDTDLAAQLNAQLDEYIVIDSDSDDDDVQFVSQSPPKRCKVDEEEVTFVKSTPPVVDVGADEALARKLHEQINGDVEVVARPTPASKPAKKKAPSSKPSSKKRPKNEGPFGGRDVLKKQRTGLFDFLSKKAKSLRIVDVVPNPHSEPGKPLYERFLSAYTFAKTKKVKLLFHGSPSQAVHKSDCHDLHAIDATPAPTHWLITHRPQNIPNILANGLDPNRRGASSGQRLGSGEYFGTHAEVSTEYCGGGRQMIVFAVLTDPRSTREGGKIVVSSDVSHQLPLCTVHIANRTPPRPTERALKVTNAAERALIRKERKRGWPFG